ncbi:MAG: hypothetical protein M1832_002458 [Thelocarpon impressellum]|nr:MAG: hypothetical protein M1832_002458 [Thelocarpon impressellum]
MPVHPSEEVADGNITEKVAKNPSSNTGSTASDHPGHKGDHSAGKASAKDFQATPGPAIPQKMSDVGEPESKEALRAKAEKLNSS